MTNWTQERCATEPEELQLIADGLYIQRKDITEVEHEATDDQEAYVDYECMSREITVSEYQMLASIEEIDTTAAIDAYTEELIEEGVL
ncbi:MAG: hypothetical protein LUC83_03055 [Clostridiales bacterium]|nr:hypothetical protein [Clostridiales bacterium]